MPIPLYSVYFDNVVEEKRHGNNVVEEKRHGNNVVGTERSQSPSSKTSFNTYHARLASAAIALYRASWSECLSAPPTNIAKANLTAIEEPLKTREGTLL